MNFTATSPEFVSFHAGCSKLVAEKNTLNVMKVSLNVTEGQRYLKLVLQENHIPTGACTHRSAFCFVDRTNGDVLKTASWSAPAKGARGNITDAHNGLGRMNSYGAGYNR